MPVKINGSIIVPAPGVTFGKTYTRNLDSGAIGADFKIDLTGTIIAFKGNPEPDGVSTDPVYYTANSSDDPIAEVGSSGWLNNIMKKQEYLRNVVSSGQSSGVPLLLEITGYAGDSGIKAYCDIENINFDDKSLWTSTCGYTISLSTNRFIESSAGIFGADSSEDAFEYYISEASEEWTAQQADSFTATINNIEDQKKLYSITHNVSAIGKRVYTGGALQLSAYEQAKGYVYNVIGLAGDLPLFFLPVNGLSVYNHKLTENINKLTGSYGVNEEFTLGPVGQSATESISITLESDTSAFFKVQIQGEIDGFDIIGPTYQYTDKYSNAEAYWVQISGLIYDRANAYNNGCALNTVPLSKSIGKNITEGKITYNYSFDNRPANIIAGALSEDIQINDIYPGQLINVVPVIGRSQPIIQYVNSRSEYKRDLTVTITMAQSGCLPVKPSASEMAVIYELYKPSGQNVYYGAPQESWSPRTGSYSYSVSWTYEV